MSEKDWKSIKPRLGEKEMVLKKCNTNFTPFETKIKLSMLGRTKCSMIANAGATVLTTVYVVKGGTQSLLGLVDGKALGTISMCPEGKEESN